MCCDLFVSLPALAEERRVGIEVTAMFKGKKEGSMEMADW